MDSTMYIGVAQSHGADNNTRLPPCVASNRARPHNHPRASQLPVSSNSSPPEVRVPSILTMVKMHTQSRRKPLSASPTKGPGIARTYARGDSRPPIVRPMTSTRILIVAIAVASATVLSCSSPAIGDRIDLDAGEVADRAERDGVIVPDGFDFVEGATYAEFVGKAGWSARYTGPAALADGKAISEANPSFPPLQTIDCSAAQSPRPGLGSETCQPGLITQFPPAGGPDSTTLQVVGDTDGTQLTVSNQGH